jgi:hypothetical protein
MDLIFRESNSKIRSVTGFYKQIMVFRINNFVGYGSGSSILS